MKVNLRKNTKDKDARPQTSASNGNGNSSFEEFRSYINNLESLLRDTLNENLKLKQQLNEVGPKKNQIDIKKLQAKVDDLSKKYSRGKSYLNDLERKMSSQNIGIKDLKKDILSENSDSNIQNMLSQYENQIEELLEKSNQFEKKLGTTEKEKEDLKTKFNDEFVLMSSVIYNLGFLYWSMKSDYEDKLKQNKGWLEMERIKQYNGDY